MSSGAELARAVAAAHAEYHEQTRPHRDPDVLVDDVVTHRMLAPHLVRALLFLVVPTVLLLIWLLLAYLASMSSPTASGAVILTLLQVAIVVLYLLGVASFVAPAKEPIAEHARLVEGGAAAGPAVARWVQDAARARRTPAEVVPDAIGGVEVLVFRQRSERAMLLVQPYGADLYVGWTLWRSRSTATLLAHFLRDTFGRWAPTPRLSAELRAAATRALRESVHSLAREAAEAARAPALPPGPPPEHRTSAPDAVSGTTPAAPPAVDAHDAGARDPGDPGERPHLPPAGRAPTAASTATAAAPRPREPVRPRSSVRPGPSTRGASTGRPDDAEGWGPPPDGDRA